MAAFVAALVQVRMTAPPHDAAVAMQYWYFVTPEPESEDAAQLADS